MSRLKGSLTFPGEIRFGGRGNLASGRGNHSESEHKSQEDIAMKAFGYVSSRLDSSVITKIITSTGILVACIEVWKHNSASTVTRKFWENTPGMNGEFIWLDDPWSNPDFLEALYQYEGNWGLNLRGQEPRSMY